MFHVFSSLAQFERRLVQERTTAGLAAARARGRLGGRRPITGADPRVQAAKTPEPGSQLKHRRDLPNSRDFPVDVLPVPRATRR